MARVMCNGVELDVACFGDPGAAPLILIRGLGSQRIHWPDPVIDGFVAAGFYVVTFDNRDAGQSDRMTTPYALRDMAEDVRALMDALTLPMAHVLGISMGGMIAQLLALAHPERLPSVTVLMSSSMAPGLPPPAPEVAAALAAEPADDTRASAIAHGLACAQLWASPAFPFDPKDRTALLGRAYDRDLDPTGTARQYQAMMAAGPDLTGIDRIKTPTLVIHGTHDTIFPIEHGRDIAARILGAQLVEVEGLGHDIEGAMQTRLVDDVTAFIGSLPARV